MKSKVIFAVLVLIGATGQAGQAQAPTDNKGNQIVVYVTGEVKKPGQQSLTKGATVLEALASAGDTTELASLRKAQLFHKRSDGKYDHTTINLKEMLAGSAPAPVCQDGDMLKIPRGLMTNIQF